MAFYESCFGLPRRVIRGCYESFAGHMLPHLADGHCQPTGFGRACQSFNLDPTQQSGGSPLSVVSKHSRIYAYLSAYPNFENYGTISRTHLFGQVFLE